MPNYVVTYIEKFVTSWFLKYIQKGSIVTCELFSQKSIKMMHIPELSLFLKLSISLSCVLFDLTFVIISSVYSFISNSSTIFKACGTPSCLTIVTFFTHAFSPINNKNIFLINIL